MDRTEQPGDRPVYVASFCAGFGFGDDAVELALGDAVTRVYCEREAAAAAVLVAEMEEGRRAPAPIWTDASTFDGRPWRGLIDLLIAGFPCQGNSVAGKREGIHDERWIWPHLADVLHEMAPPYVLLENVPGLLTVNSGEAFREILSDLATLGYDTEYGLFRASDVGAPHRRERWFLFARNRAVVDDEGRGHPRIESLIDWQRPVVGAEPGADGGAPAGDRAARVRICGEPDSAGAEDLRDRDVPALADVDARGDVGIDPGIGRREGWPEHAGIEGRSDAAESGGVDGRGALADGLRAGDGGRLGEAGDGRGVRQDGDPLDGGRVADGGSTGLPLGGGESGDVRAEQPAAERDGHQLVRVADLAAGRGDVGDDFGLGLERRGAAGDLASQTGEARGEGLQREWRRRAAGDPGAGAMPLFPPGPRSLRWLAVAYHRPDLFPALDDSGRIPSTSPFYPFFIAGERARALESRLHDLADRGDRSGPPRSYLPDCGCDRTDILRGAGNGVVPHVEALALLVLISRMGWPELDRRQSEEVESQQLSLAT